jgi:hypothetical protein
MGQKKLRGTFYLSVTEALVCPQTKKVKAHALRERSTYLSFVFKNYQFSVTSVSLTLYFYFVCSLYNFSFEF